MSQPADRLSPENLRALDQLRVRLSTLATTLAELRVNLERHDPLPSWPSLTSTAQILSHHLLQTQRTLQQNAAFFHAAHAYPLPGFPGATQHVLLQQLLRKKLEPGLEKWVLEHAKAPSQPGPGDKDGGGLEVEGQRELWNWAGPAGQEVLVKLMEDDSFGSNFTLAEQEAGIENVRTGLRRKLYDDAEDDDEDGEKDADNGDGAEGEKMDEDKMPTKESLDEASENRLGVVPGEAAIPLENVMRYISMGTAPANLARGP